MDAIICSPHRRGRLPGLLPGRNVFGAFRQRGGQPRVTSIMHVITGLGMGGAENTLLQTAVGLEQRGHAQRVFSLAGPGVVSELLEQAGVSVINLGVRSMITAPAALSALINSIRRDSPAIVQGWMYHGNVAATLGSMLARPGKPRRLIWNLRASNMDSIRYGRIMRWNARLSRCAHTIVVNSQAGASFHRNIGFSEKRMRVIANGIDTMRFRPDGRAREVFRFEHGMASDARIVLWIARVDPMKDHASFLAAMARLPKLQGILVGAGTETLALPPNVRALGFCRDLAKIYAAADIIVSSSAFGEGFPNVIVEGMSAGLVPVGTDVGDLRAIVGTDGEVVPPRDVDALTQAIARVAAHDADSLRALGARARQRVVANFGLSAMVDAYEHLYTQGALSGIAKKPNNELDLEAA